MEFFYKDLILIFEKLMKEKINEYINHIPNNKNVNTILESYGLTIDGKET